MPAENISFELSHLVAWPWFGVTLPMDEESFKQKLTHLTASDKLGLIKEALVRVWSSVLFNWKPEDVYQAIFELYTVVDGIDLNIQPSTPSKTGRVDIAPEDALIQHWTGKYIGPSRDILRERIRDYERQFSDGFYSKSLLFVQSSGAGKSRLADAFGEIFPMISYVIRKDLNGFPPRDKEILDFMQSNPSSAQEEFMSSPSKSLTDVQRSERVANIWHHAVSVGILQASFEIYHEQILEWINAQSYPPQLVEIATFSHDKMAPAPGGRSAFRVGGFWACFDDTERPQIRDTFNVSHCKTMKGLRRHLTSLEETLENLYHDSKEDPLLVMVFDEVSSLLGEEGKLGRFIALNRLISCISTSHRVWCFFLSTNSNLDQLLPPDHASREESTTDQPSWRWNFRLKRYPPFTEFAVDILDVRNRFLLAPKDEVMSQFIRPTHMAKFGRPLWLAYSRPDHVARIKIIGGNPSRAYDAYNENHVFAAMSVRLCIDVNLANPPFVTETPHSFLC
ncbi:hypothetical protein V8E54_000520 [Elaphomyces granulatus]